MTVSTEIFLKDTLKYYGYAQNQPATDRASSLFSFNMRGHYEELERVKRFIDNPPVQELRPELVEVIRKHVEIVGDNVSNAGVILLSHLVIVPINGSLAALLYSDIDRIDPKNWVKSMILAFSLAGIIQLLTVTLVANSVFKVKSMPANDIEKMAEYLKSLSPAIDDRQAT